MTQASRYKTGRLEPRFIVERTDGQPIDPSRRYSLVLDFSGADPHAITAAKAYADSVQTENPDLAADIWLALRGDVSLHRPSNGGYAQ